MDERPGQAIFRARHLREILALALPIIGGMISQSLMNLADTFLVGRLPEAECALAAIGYGSVASMTGSSLLIGIGAGVQVIAARRIGEGRRVESGQPLTEALLLSLTVGVLFSLIGALAAQSIFRFLTKDAGIVAAGAGYLIVRDAGWFIIMGNFAYRGFFNGIGSSRVYLMVVWGMQILNVLVSLPLIFGWGPLPRFGVMGAGIGTTLATTAATLAYVAVSRRWFRKSHGALTRAATAAERAVLRASLIRLSLPAGLTNLLTTAGFLTFLKITGTVGRAESAATTILVNLTQLCNLPAVGFGLASATFVSRSLGARRPDEAFAWGIRTVCFGSMVIGSLALAFLLWPRGIVGFFTHDAHLIELARRPLGILGAGLLLDAAGTIFAQSLIGAGSVRPVLITNALGMWGVFLPGAYLFGQRLGYGMLGLWYPLFVFRLGVAIVMATVFLRRRWVHIKV
jgi:putative MATE family efflux protein